MNKLEGLSIESQEYEEIIEELKKSVCDKVSSSSRSSSNSSSSTSGRRQ